MKQLLFMIALTLVGTVGSFVYHPFWGIAVYYFFAVLRPQYIWEWVLRDYGEIRWSFFVAIATVVATLAFRFRILRPILAQDEEGPSLFPNLSHLSLLAFGGWILVSFVTARNQDAALYVVVEYLKIFVMYVVSAMMLRKLWQLWIMLILTALALCYISYEVNILYLTYRRITIYDTGYSGLDNNGAGLMLAMGVPMCMYIWDGMQSRWRWFFPLMVPFLLHAVLMSYSRGAMLSLIVATPLIIYRFRHRRLLLLAAVAVGSVVLPIMAGPEIRARFFSIERFQQDKSAQSRFGSWTAAWEMAVDHPITGVGPRNANLFSYEYGADEKGRTIHSQYFQILADNGFPGLFLYLLAIVTAWRSTNRGRRAVISRDSPEARQAYAIACSVESAMVIFCFGAIFLSLEVFELPYLILLLAAQLPGVLGVHRIPDYMLPIDEEDAWEAVA